MSDKGIVHIIGGGPGDPGLLTLKARECLAQADAVVYDRLANLHLLSHAPEDAEFHDVGKIPGNHNLTQDGINNLLSDLALRGFTVARLHGGDPFVFGRGGEEADHLGKLGIPYLIVPGITSAIAAPAYAGIPVTDRRRSGSFAVCTGHKAKDAPDLGASHMIAGSSGTLIYLMGIGNIREIAERLIQEGKDPCTTAAAIQWGTTSHQKTVTATLGTLPEAIENARLTSPAVVIIGDVVGLGGSLEWRKGLPLSGKRVLLTRPLEQGRRFAGEIMSLGGEPLVFPVIAQEVTDGYGLLEGVFERLKDYGCILFTSGNGVEFFFKGLSGSSLDSRALAGINIGSIGMATGAKLRERGIIPDLEAKESTSEGLLEAISTHYGGSGGLAGTGILLPRAEGGREYLVEGLRDLGARVDEIRMYRSVLPSHNYYREIRRHLLQGLERSLHYITFTSASTVRNFTESLGRDRAADLCREAKVLCIGPETEKQALEEGLSVYKVASERNMGGLLSTLLCDAALEGGDH